MMFFISTVMQTLMNVQKRYTSVIKIVETLLDLTFVLAMLAMNWTLLAILVLILTNAVQTYTAVLRYVSMLMDSTTVVVTVGVYTNYYAYLMVVISLCNFMIV